MREFNLQKFVILVLLVGITLVIGIYITDSLTTVTRAYGTSGTAINETLAAPTDAGVLLSASSLRDGDCGSIIYLINGTSGAGYVIQSMYYTQSGCTVHNTSVWSANWTSSVRVTYPFSSTADTAASNASGNITTALSTGTSWISILVVVGFATIILTMLTSGLGKAGREAETPYY